jgi:hypothetical protein
VTRHVKPESPSHLDEYVAQYARFWERLASEFLDPVARKEYASLKHGLRVRPGKCEISITPEVSPGIADPQARPTVMRGSGFGSGF